MDLLVKKIHLAATLLILLVVCAIAPLAQSGRSGMRGYVAFENLSYDDVAERKVHETELGVVGLFGVGETGAFTEPSAVAPDAGVNLVMTVDNSRVHGKLISLQGSRIKLIQFTPGCILLNREIAPASGATALLGSVKQSTSLTPN